MPPPSSPHEASQTPPTTMSPFPPPSEPPHLVLVSPLLFSFTKIGKSSTIRSKKLLSQRFFSTPFKTALCHQGNSSFKKGISFRRILFRKYLTSRFVQSVLQENPPSFKNFSISQRSICKRGLKITLFSVSFLITGIPHKL